MAKFDFVNEMLMIKYTHTWKEITENITELHESLKFISESKKEKRLF